MLRPNGCRYGWLPLVEHSVLRSHTESQLQSPLTLSSMGTRLDVDYPCVAAADIPSLLRFNHDFTQWPLSTAQNPSHSSMHSSRAASALDALSLCGERRGSLRLTKEQAMKDIL